MRPHRDLPFLPHRRPRVFRRLARCPGSRLAAGRARRGRADARRSARVRRDRADGRPDERRTTACHWHAPSRRAIARGGRPRDPRARPLPRRAALRAGAGGAGHARARHRDRLARRRSLRRCRAAGMVRRPRRVHDVRMALRRVRAAGRCDARAHQRVQCASGVCGRRTAHRLPVPHRDDRGAGRNVARERRGRASRGIDARHAERRRHPPRSCPRASQRCIASRTTSMRAGRKDSRASGFRVRPRPSAAGATGAAPGRAERRRRSR